MGVLEMPNQSPSSAYTVSAIVVTFNRLDWLKKVIDSLVAQTYFINQIVIIDNCSTDQTSDWLKQFVNNPQFRIYHAKQNLGGAGGFAKGMEIAMTSGNDFLWIMDDDCIPEANALDKLIHSWSWFKNNTPYTPGFACSLVKFQDTEDICEMNIPKPIWDWTRFYNNQQIPAMLVETCSFVSALVHRDKVKEVGLPYAEYFIWYDDVEYTRRLSRSYPGILVLDSIVRHFTPNNRGVNFSDVNDKNLWKFKYGARNEASYRYHHQGVNSWRKFSQRVNLQLHEGGVSLAIRAEINKSLLEGIKFNPKVKRV